MLWIVRKVPNLFDDFRQYIPIRGEIIYCEFLLDNETIISF